MSLVKLGKLPPEYKKQNEEHPISSGIVLNPTEKILIPDIPDLPTDQELPPYKKPLHREEDETVVITRIQNNRHYLQNVDWGQCVVTLPDVFINEHQSARFVFDANRRLIRMIPRRDCLDKLVQLIDKKIKSDSFNYYLSGQAGCGKSSLLYQLVCRLMGRDDFVVVYVQDSDKYLIANILRSLYLECKSDHTLPPEIVGYLDKLEFAEFKLRAMINQESPIFESKYEPETNPMVELLSHIDDLLDCMKSKLTKAKRTLIYIFDQTNNLMADPEFFSLIIKFMSRHLFKRNIVILSGSANNETEFFPKVTPRMLRLPFTEEELKTFIKLNIPAEIEEKAKWYQDSAISQILGITGAVALEIYRFVTGIYDGFQEISTNVPLNQRFNDYSRRFFNLYNNDMVIKWYDNIKNEDKKKIALENIQKCLLGIDVNAIDSTIYDKRIIAAQERFKIENELIVLKDLEISSNIKEFLVPVSPLARESLLRAYGSRFEISEYLKQFRTIKTILNDSLRGFYIGRLLITLISLNKLSKVLIEHFDHSGYKAKIKFVFENFKRINFGGYFTPPSDLDTRLGNILFVPEKENYPGFDFIYYEADQDTALFFNVTIQKDCVLRVKDNDSKAQSGSIRSGTLFPAIKAWVSFFPLKTTFRDVFIVRRNEFDHTMLTRSCNFVFLEDLNLFHEELSFLSDYFTGWTKASAFD